ncbi:MAG: TIGR04552 family protein [Myxococcales bacterium]|nr:TIGR04552 family protein [Myxococcales bacterium]
MALSPIDRRANAAARGTSGEPLATPADDSGPIAPLPQSANDPARRTPLDAFSLADLEAVRLLLGGGSVIDWQRLALRDLADVDRFLRVNEFRPDDERDLVRLEQIRDEAVDYLVRNFGFRFPDDVAEGLPVRELFLLASRKSRRQMYACVVLKAMHVIHHLAGRELLYRLPVSDDEVFRLVERKVVRTVEEIRGAGYPITEFQWSRKPRDSLILKLMAKTSTLAANIYDKLRFRLIVRDESDLVPLLRELSHRLVPFNYVVPGQSVNEIVNLGKLVATMPALERLQEKLQTDASAESRAATDSAGAANEFSGPGYRVVNFVADVPVRIDEFLGRVADPAVRDFGAIVFVLTEFQVIDRATALANEVGENSHDRYKERQQNRVRMRLMRGQLLDPPAAPPPADTVPGIGRGSDD